MFITVVEARIGNRVSAAGSIGMAGSPVTHPAFPLSTALRRFDETDDEVRFELLANFRKRLQQAVLDGRLHVAIGPFTGCVADTGGTPA